MAMTLKVGIIEKNKDLRVALTTYFNIQHDQVIVWKVKDIEDAIKNQDIIPDVVLMGRIEGSDIEKDITTLQANWKKIPILILAEESSPKEVYKALSNGVKGHLMYARMANYLRNAIVEVNQGGVFVCPISAQYLTQYLRRPAPEAKIPLSIDGISISEKDREIIKGLLKGHTYEEIARTNYMSIDSVRYHIKQLYQHFEVSNKVAFLNKVRKAIGQ